jgi:lipopolysaccharide/colanic/teichoic acid biosynthesis glycosyltransferase
MQRIFDLFCSVLAIFVLLPILIPVTLILRFTGEREIFFLQERIGKNGISFKLYKFATMLKNSPNINTGTLTIKNDPRILPFGRLLRKSKINELPQLLNILFGDMSLVGPRPLTNQSFNAYDPSIQNIIMKVKPGLSGVGSIIFRNEEEILNSDEDPLLFYSEVIAPYKGQLECWFVDNNNLKTYFLVIAVTIYIIFFPGSDIAWKVFNGVPKPPKKLILSLNWI